ncbi:MAG: hypothetical protein ABFR53_05765 [Actinomycetota bacterium]
MKPSYSTSFVVGAVVGLVVAIAILLFVGSLGGVSYLNPSIETGSVDPVFSIPASALWMMTLIAGFGGGAVLSAITFGIARVIDPDATPVPSVIVILVGAVVGATVAISVMLLGAGVLGTVADGIATVTVVEMVVFTAVIGLAGGATVTWLSYLLARPVAHETDPELLAA